MYIVHRTLRFINGYLKSYGPSPIKKVLWDGEFSSGKWNFIDNTAGDCVYQHLEKYLANGSLLDLGCGPGNTANELAANAYANYVGVDVSEEALQKAARRSEASGRAKKNMFVCSDFLSYRPAQGFDVILFRESLYHVPMGKIEGLLRYYSNHLTPNGVFIVRMSVFDENGRSKYRPGAMLRIIEDGFDVVGKFQYGCPGPTVIIFRPRSAQRAA